MNGVTTGISKMQMICTVYLKTNITGGGEVFQTAITPNGLAPALKEEYPEIIRSSRYESHPMPLKKGDDFIFEVLAFVDKDFLEHV